jgi:hypothetical protein
MEMLWPQLAITRGRPEHAKLHWAIPFGSQMESWKSSFYQLNSIYLPYATTTKPFNPKQVGVG